MNHQRMQAVVVIDIITFLGVAEDEVRFALEQAIHEALVDKDLPKSAGDINISNTHVRAVITPEKVV